jgi:hypothetical protein
MLPIGGVTFIISIIVILIHSLVVGASKLFRWPLGNKWSQLLLQKEQLLAMITICLVIAVIAGISSQVISIGLTQDNNNLAIARNLMFTCSPPTLKDGETAVILRLDDVQAFGWTEISIMMIKDASKAGFPVTAGVIPEKIDQDVRTAEFLLDYGCTIELALHGYDHAPNADNPDLGEFALIGFEEAQIRLIKGRKILQKYSDEPIDIFIPPHNQLSGEAIEALAETNFTIISSAGAHFLDYDTATYDFIENTIVPAKAVIADCEEGFSRGDLLCVITLHPQDFAKDINSVDPVLYAEYLKILEWLVKKEIPVITLREALARQSELDPNF